MFAEIKGQFINGLKEQYWMDNETRAQAHLKASEWRYILGLAGWIYLGAIWIQPGSMHYFVGCFVFCVYVCFYVLCHVLTSFLGGDMHAEQNIPQIFFAHACIPKHQTTTSLALISVSNFAMNWFLNWIRKCAALWSWRSDFKLFMRKVSSLCFL